MGDLNGAAGAMLSVNADSASVRQLLNGSGAVIAAFNSRSQTIVSGDAKTVAEVAGRARSNGFEAVPLAVSHAFHSHLVGPAVPAFATALETEHFEPLGRTVVSTVSGRRLNPDDDLRDLLERQVTDPVRFLEALSAADGDVDLWIEVGPGSILTKLAGQSVDTAAIALDAGGPSLEGLLHVTAALFTAGYPLRLEPAFRDRSRSTRNRDFFRVRVRLLRLWREPFPSPFGSPLSPLPQNTRTLSAPCGNWFWRGATCRPPTFATTAGFSAIFISTRLS
jgi:enediyne polyketide synthase